MQYTENYDLKKPDLTDNYSVSNDNYNSDIIDTNLKELSDNIADIRVGADGNIYTSAGNSVRAIANGIGIVNNSIKLQKLNDYISASIGDYVLQEKILLLSGYYVDGVYYANTGYRSKKFNCNPYDVIKVSTYITTATMSIITFYGANGVYVSQIGKGLIGTYVDYLVESPPNAYFFTLTSKVDATHPSASIDLFCNAKTYTFKVNVIKKLMPNIQISYSLVDKKIKVATKYDATTDMVKTIEPCGASLLPQIRNFFKISNTNKYVSDDFTSATTWYNISSDWIGPYSALRAVNNIDGDNTAYAWTGGWHGYNGDETGSATARNVSMGVYIDGKKITSDYIGGANLEVKVVVVNNIQGCNTKVFDGTGREILQETIAYTFLADGSINVDVKIEPLEDIQILQYYGIQTNNAMWNTSILHIDDISNIKGYDGSALSLDVNSSDTTVGRYCHEVKFEKGSDKMDVWFDKNYGLGTLYKNNVGSFITKTYGKSYFRLIDTGETQNLVVGEILVYRGGYKFYSI